MFVITAKKNNDTLFYAIDNNSGGYPYWSTYLVRAKTYNEYPPEFLTEMGSCLTYMAEEVDSIQVCRVDLVVYGGKFYTKSIKEQQKQKERDEIQKEMDRLTAKLKELE